jgi:hypothetical protein
VDVLKVLSASFLMLSNVSAALRTFSIHGDIRTDCRLSIEESFLSDSSPDSMWEGGSVLSSEQ